MIKYTDRQRGALKRLINKKILHHLHYGSSRAGKTVLDALFVINRCLKYHNTRHLVCRASKASCISSVWMQTLLPILEEHYRGLWHEDQTRRIINFITGSSLWAGGFDNKIHRDEMLAKEWATIWIEEATDLQYYNFIKLSTRLNWDPEKSDIPLKLIAECNPPTTTHWLNQYFIKGIDYETRQSLSAEEIAENDHYHFDLESNISNLNPRYVAKMRNSKGLNRKRFYEGIFADNFDGQIYDAFDRSVNVVYDPIEYDPNLETWRFWDFGVNPSDTAIIWLQFAPVPKSKEFPEGFKINIIDCYINNELDYNHYADVCQGRPYKNDNIRDAGDPAGGSRNESLESWVSKLASRGIYIERPKGKPSTADYITNANEYVPYMRMCEKQVPPVVEMFENWSRPKDRDGRTIEGSLPEHNSFSHPGTALYYGLMVKYPYKKTELFLP